jgi:hypothetical protein
VKALLLEVFESPKTRDRPLVSHLQSSNIQQEGLHMTRPRREEFILDVRRAARSLQKPNWEADSGAMDTDAVSRVLYGAASWLTPKVVENYQPDDFAAAPSERQEALHRSVHGFQTLASQVPPDKPATVQQFMEGVEHFRDLIKVLGEIVLAEWMHAVDTIECEAERWSQEAEWRTGL